MLAPDNTAPRETPSLFKRMLDVVGLGGPPPRARPYTEMGVSGTAVYGGYVVVRERSAEWIGAQRYVTIADMAVNASIVAAGVHYFLNLIAHPKWTVEPADESAQAKQVAEFVDACLRDLSQPWSRVVRRAGTYRFYGFGLQEWTAKRRPDGRVGLLSLEPRPQHTIERWSVAEDGAVRGVWQRAPQTGAELGIPRSKLMYLVDDVLTDSPEGVGLFRHLAEPWNRLKQYYALEARAFERDLRGTPIGRVPYTQLNQAVADGVLTQAQANTMVEAMEKFVKMQVKQSDTAITIDSIPYFSQAADGAKVAATPQWGVELLQGGAAGMVEVAAAITRTQLEMARVLTCEHLMMGESSGNRALSEDKSRNLYLVANSVLSDMAAAVNQDIVPPLCDLNGIPEELRPKCTVEDVAFKDADAVAATLQKMAQAGAVLAPDDPVIADVRALMGVSAPTPIPPELLGMGLPGKKKPGEEDEDEDDEGGPPEGEDEDEEEDEEDVEKHTPGGHEHDQQTHGSGGGGGDSGGSQTVFHGTSSGALASIASKGLRFSGDHGKVFAGGYLMDDEDRGNSVYVTTDQTQAHSYGQFAAKKFGGQSVILEIRVPADKVKEFKADEREASALRLAGKNIPPEWISSAKTWTWDKKKKQGSWKLLPLQKADAGLRMFAVTNGQRSEDDEEDWPWIAKFDPNQPRAPAGTSEGGRWTAAGGGSSAAADEGTGVSSEGAAQALLAENHDPSVTLESLTASLTDQQRELMAAARDGIARGTPTREQYLQADGTYTPERERLHEQILARMFTPEAVAAATPAPGERPEFVMTGGRPAAGKTTGLRAGGIDVGPPKYIYLSADTIQEELPGYRGDHAGLYNPEGQDIADKAETMARRLGVNLVFDATMKTGQSAVKRVAAFREAGYDVSAFFVHTAPQVSARRSLERFVRSGRFVPPEVSLNSLTNEKTFDDVTPLLKRWVLIDNNGTKPRVVRRHG